MYSLNKNLIRQALDLSPAPTIILDFKAMPPAVVYANQAFEAASGYDVGEVVGLQWNRLCPGSSDAGEQPAAEAQIACHPRLGGFEPLQMDMSPLYDRPGVPRYWVGTEQPRTQSALLHGDTERDALFSVLRDARMHLRRLDGRDTVTGLLNRQAFGDLLERDWVLARREQRPLALLLVRLDSYSGYRDVFGRHAADSCIRKVAHAVTGTLRRAGDLTARYADDQLVVLLGHADAQQAQRLAEKIAVKVRELAIHHPRSPRDRYVTVSCGCGSLVPQGVMPSTDLIARAELNLAEPECSTTLPLQGYAS